MAREAIQAGRVTVDGAPALKAATQVHGGQALVVLEPPPRYVSRGGEKLEHGLEVFGVDPEGRRCLDAGVSTGGFTDCLLQRGAAQVLAFDVGYGQVHERIRTDPRVVVSERTNIRDVVPSDLPGGPVDLIVCDVSFIALQAVLPVLAPLGTPDAEAVVLVKPQFEAARQDVQEGGVVREPSVWRRVLLAVAASAAAVGWPRFEVTPSPLLGPAGNVEFLAHLGAGAPRAEAATVDAAVAAGEALRDGGTGEEGT